MGVDPLVGFRGLADAIRNLGSDVLVKGAAQSDIQDLDPPADGKNRELPPDGQVGHLDLKMIQPFIHLLQPRKGLFSVSSWVNVGAPAQDDALKGSQDRFKAFLVLLHGNDERGASGV